jgi:ribonuclease HII
LLPGAGGRQKEAGCVSEAVLKALSRQFSRLGRPLVAGVDEVGRGCLAGPVVAAAVVLPPGFAPAGIDDSKKLSAARREELLARMTAAGALIGIGVVSASEIDRINILQASLAAMVKALAGIHLACDLVVVDGRQPLPLSLPQYPLVRGDSRCLPVAAASIAAKVVRDRQMLYYDRRFPGYGFARHKGYGTAAHRRAVGEHGPCILHRRSFRCTLPQE